MAYVHTDSKTAIFNQLYPNSFNTGSNILPPIENVSKLTCVHRCTATKSCKSVNYHVSKNICELKSTAPLQLQLRYGWLFISSNYFDNFEATLLTPLPPTAATTTASTTPLSTTAKFSFVEQSSTYKMNSTYAFRAIDEVFINNDTDFCAVTEESSGSWWRLTLAKETIINSVTVITVKSKETSRLAGFKLKIGNAEGKYTLCGSLTGIVSKKLTCNLRGKYVEIGDKKSVDKLILCEVIVKEL